MTLSEQITSAVRSVIGTNPAALHEPLFEGDEEKLTRECVETGWVSSVGKFVDAFERGLAEYTGASHAIAVTNGTAALHVALVAAGVGRSDEVLVPALTFIGTVNPIAYCGATPHFIDSLPNAPEIDIEALEAYLDGILELRGGSAFNKSTGARLAAILPVHVFGHPVDMDHLADISERYKIPVIEDAAEAMGSTYKGRHAGTFGLLGTLSFNGNKIITTGGGGAVLTNDADLARRIKHLSTTARVAHRMEFIHDMVGYNYRMPNINAALGVAQLRNINNFVLRKRILADRYAAVIEKIPAVRLLREGNDTQSNYWLQTLILDEEIADQRDQVLSALNDAGYGARPVWRLMHTLPMFESSPRMDLSGAEGMAARIVNIPSGPALVQL
ncbi:LegC family aminotransferase [Bradyrhizobium erythrophlei]|nr:LegC family aminotransferase [Bradyrhizobium erythrophlei]